MTASPGHPLFNLTQWANAATSAGVHAVHGCGGACEVNLAIERPGSEQAIDEAGMEDVACAGGIDNRDFKGWGVEHAMAVPAEDALLAEGGGSEARAVASEHFLEGGFETEI